MTQDLEIKADKKKQAIFRHTGSFENRKNKTRQKKNPTENMQLHTFPTVQIHILQSSAALLAFQPMLTSRLIMLSYLARLNDNN